MPRALLIVAAAVFAIAFAVYTRTMAPTVSLVDSGALTVAVAGLGVPHPPGFPFFVMVTHLFTVLPFGSVAWLTNFASVVFASLACAMTSLAAAEARLSPDDQKEDEPKTFFRTRDLIAPAVAGLLLAFSRTLWRYATITEVYALNTFLIATVLWLMLSWRRTGRPRRLYAAAVVFGLGLGVHHVSTGLMLIAIAALVLRENGIRFIRTKQFAIAAVLAMFTTAAVYAYLPIAASHDPVLNWGDPGSPERLVAHVTGEQYRRYFTAQSTSDQLIRTFGYLARDLAPSFLPVSTLLALAGLVSFWRRDRTMFWFFLLVILSVVSWTLFYPIQNDQDAYLLPALVALVIAAAQAATWILSSRRWVAPLLILLPVVSLSAFWQQRDRSNSRVAEDYVANTLRTMDRGALLITSDWQLYSPMLYFLEIEKVRTDVKLFEYGMATHSWYVEALERRHPELLQHAQKELAAYRSSLRDAEEKPEEWKRDQELQREFLERLHDLILAMVKGHIERGGAVYATLDVALSRHETDRNLVRALSASYALVPRGLVVEYLPRNQQKSRWAIPLRIQSLLEEVSPQDPDDPVTNQLVPAYLRALYLRGRFLREAGRFDEATESLRQALVLDPQSAVLQSELKAVEAGRAARGEQ